MSGKLNGNVDQKNEGTSYPSIFEVYKSKQQKIKVRPLIWYSSELKPL